MNSEVYDCKYLYHQGAKFYVCEKDDFIQKEIFIIFLIEKILLHSLFC